MAIIKAKSVPRKKVDAQALLAEFCWYYQQYTLAQARRLPAKDVIRLLRMAHKKEAEHYFNLTQIAAAPHTKNGTGVKRLSSRYKGMMNG